MGFLRINVVNLIRSRFFASKNQPAMKYLNVAEKNDAAKNIAAILSRGNSNRREGFSQYNKIYEFDATVFTEQARMVMTSVSGHLLNYAFVSTFKSWKSCNPSALFDAAVIKTCPEEYQNIKRTLEREIRSCQGLIIWTDCDREGENIGFEIIKVCTDVKPNLRIYRAKFSEITGPSVFRALNNLAQPDLNTSKAVDVRMELDLRTGAAFTRLQTLRLQKVFPQKLDGKLISYGSCQFPTLGFVVERYQKIENFIAQLFWKIKMSHTVKDIKTDFTWLRERLFDKPSVEAILDICQERNQCTVKQVENKVKNKWRPLPLDTVEMEKIISRKLKINAKETMKIAEKLYTQGFISYPRTETNIYPKELNLTSLVEMQFNDQSWGSFAQRVMSDGGPTPRHGKKSDQAHPPIHPTKYASNLQGNEQRVYEYIVRHFLASVHKDAEGYETVVTVDLADETFIAKGLIILERNYLDVYIYENWNAKVVYNYQEGDTFVPTTLEMVESETSPPKLLTEADLIALMEKHGIGTDATHAEHIETIKARDYVGLHENIYFVPGTLGMGLVEGYNTIGLEISLAQPNLRANFENDLKLICSGQKDAEQVRMEQIQNYKNVFKTVAEKMSLIDASLSRRLDDVPQAFQNDISTSDEYKPAMKCPKCSNDMIIKTKKDGGKYMTCVGYPDCKNTVWFPQIVQNVHVMDTSCDVCGSTYKHLKFHFKQNPFPGEPNPILLCLGGCDDNVLETLDISRSSVKRNPNAVRPSNEIAPIFTAVQNRNNNISRPTTNGNSRNNTTLGNVSVQFSNNTVNSSRVLSNVNNNSLNQGAEDHIVCTCNVEAILLEVRKEGPNKGRKFYKCSNNACNFFLWGSDGTSNSNTASTSTFDTSSSGGIPQCNCLLPAVTRTVSKAGPNVGRQFYCCSKPQNQGCNFFQWGDSSGQSGPSRNENNDGRPGPGNAKRKRNTDGSNPPTTRAKRKCGICAQEGHTRKNCPNK